MCTCTRACYALSLSLSLFVCFDHALYMNAGNDNVQCFPLSRGRRPKEINCCLVFSLSLSLSHTHTHTHTHTLARTHAHTHPSNTHTTTLTHIDTHRHRHTHRHTHTHQTNTSPAVLAQKPQLKVLTDNIVYVISSPSLIVT